MSIHFFFYVFHVLTKKNPQDLVIIIFEASMQCHQKIWILLVMLHILKSSHVPTFSLMYSFRCNSITLHTFLYIIFMIFYRQNLYKYFAKRLLTNYLKISRFHFTCMCGLYFLWKLCAFLFPSYQTRLLTFTKRKKRYIDI